MNKMNPIINLVIASTLILIIQSCESCIHCKCYKNNAVVKEKEYCGYGKQDANQAEIGLEGSGDYDDCECY